MKRYPSFSMMVTGASVGMVRAAASAGMAADAKCVSASVGAVLRSVMVVARAE